MLLISKQQFIKLMKETQHDHYQINLCKQPNGYIVYLDFGSHAQTLRNSRKTDEPRYFKTIDAAMNTLQETEINHFNVQIAFPNLNKTKNRD